MKKLIIGMMLACGAVCALAQTNADANSATNAAPKKKMTLAERKAMMKQRMYERTGGFVIRPGSQMGKIVYLNGQSRVAQSAIEKQTDLLAEILKVKIEIVKGDADFSLKDVKTRKQKVAANAAIFFVDDPTLSDTTMLVAPENGWAMVNLAAIASDKPDAAKLEKRLIRETWRSFAHLLGAANSTQPKCVLRPVSDPADLDDLFAECFCPEPLDKIVHNLRAIGVEAAETRTYRQACIEGWAPMPTNSVQRTMWEQARADKERGPTKPITIAPPKK